jgi:predicted DNA-binding transcriptional regulator YafY
MPDTLMRQWEMLRLIPRAPRKIDGASLEQKLRDVGYDIDRRSVQRDLQKLSELFPIYADERSKPFGWSWSTDGAVFDIPGMDSHAALAFHLAGLHLQGLLPAPLSANLKPWFDRAGKLLGELRAGGVKTWAHKVCAVPPVLPRLPPRVDPIVHDAVHEALFREKRLHLSYGKRGESDTKEYDASPLGLVTRDAMAYLVCTLRDYTDVVQLALHRIRRAEVQDHPAPPPKGWSLEAYVRSGALGFLRADQPVKLAVLIEPFAAVSLQEAPLSKDQTALKQADGRMLLTATVADTTELRTWLLGLGALGEVVGPASLREEIAQTVRKMAGRYEVGAG